METISRAVLGSMPVWCSRAWCTAGSAGGNYGVRRTRRRRAEASAARPIARRSAVAGSGIIAAGKPPNVALIALARKLLTILNAMVRDRTDWQETAT